MSVDPADEMQEAKPPGTSEEAPDDTLAEGREQSSGKAPQESGSSSNIINILIVAAVAFFLMVACAILILLLLRSTSDAEATPTRAATAGAETTDTALPEATNTPGPITDDSWSRIQAAGRMVVGTSADYPPFEFYTPDFQLDGFDIALIREIGRRLGVEVEIRDMAFDGLGGALEVNQIDVAISAITVTPEREDEADFTSIYFVSEDAILANADSAINSIPSEGELAAMRVGVQSGTVYENWLQGNLVDSGMMPADNLISYQNIEKAIEDLGQGLIDLVALDLQPAEVAAASGGVKVVGQGLNRQPFAMAVQQGASSLQAELNRVLLEMQGDGTVANLIGEYLNLNPDEIAPVPTPDPIVPTPTPGSIGGPCIDAMAFVANLSFDDQRMTDPQRLPPGQPFQKGWRVRNTGTCTWNDTYSLAPVGGNVPAARMGGQPVAVDGLVQPGEEYDFWADLVSPLQPGVHQEFWTMRNDTTGILFGDRMWVGIEVVAVATATPLPTQTPTADIRFTVDPDQINSGECSTLAWQTQNVQAVYLYEQGQPWQQNGVPGSGTRTVCPASMMTYELRVVKMDGSVEIRQVTVFVTPVVTAPVITRFTVDPPYQITAGQCVTIRWTVEGDVSRVDILHNDTVLWGGAPTSSSVPDCPPAGEQAYSIVATGPGGTARDEHFLNVVPPATPMPPTSTPLPVATPVPPTPDPPAIHSFAVIPNQIAMSECVQVIWNVGGGAELVQILRDGIVVLDNAPYSGNVQDCLAEAGSVIYGVLASNSGGETASDQASVIVTEGEVDNPLGGTSWTLLSYFDGATIAPPLEGTTVTASFQPDGEAVGSAGCNPYAATYQVQGNTLTVSALSITGRLCAEPPGIMEQESAYLGALLSAATYQIVGQQLVVSDSSGQVVVTFAALVATPL